MQRGNHGIAGMDGIEIPVSSSIYKATESPNPTLGEAPGTKRGIEHPVPRTRCDPTRLIFNTFKSEVPCSQALTAVDLV
jgi:hypothetical protein